MDIIELVQAELDRIAAGAQQFAANSGLSCPPGCGSCCLSPDVEAMPVEMLPMAKHILDSGLAVDTTGRQCPMFMPNPLNAKLGRCGAYGFRPSICRIFPYGFSRDKNGESRWRPCSQMTNPAAGVESATRDVFDGNGISYELARHDLQDLAPNMAARLPINEALAEAIQSLGLRLDNERK